MCVCVCVCVWGGGGGGGEGDGDTVLNKTLYRYITSAQVIYLGIQSTYHRGLSARLA